MGGGSDRTERVIQNTSGSGPPQIVPEFQPFAQKVGQAAEQAVGYPELNLRRFAVDQTVPIAGLSPLEQQARGMVAQRGAFGIPVPYPEQAAFGSTVGALGSAQDMANRTAG